MPKWTPEIYAIRARRAAQAFDYDDEYDEDSILRRIVRDDDPVTIDGEPDVALRYLVIGVEEAGSGEAHNSGFYGTVRGARQRMAEFASEGWASFLWDLDENTVMVKQERFPR